MSAPPAWIGRSIATHKFRLIEHSAFVEEQRLHDAYHKHLFVHIGGEVVYSDPPLEVNLIKKLQQKAFWKQKVPTKSLRRSN